MSYLVSILLFLYTKSESKLYKRLFSRYVKKHRGQNAAQSVLRIYSAMTDCVVMLASFAKTVQETTSTQLK